MNRSGAILVSAVLFLLSTTSLILQKQEQPQLVITADSVNAQSTAGNVSSESSLLTLAYGKLAKFIRGGNVREAKLGRGEMLASSNEIKFEMRNIHSGSIEEIYDSLYGSVVTKPSGDVLQIDTGEVKNNDEPEKIAYVAKWVVRSYEGTPKENWEKATVKEVFEMTGNALPPVKKYISYEAKVYFRGKERSYRAMVLYHPDSRSSKVPRVSFLDNIVSPTPLTKAFSETRPAVE